MSRLKSAYRPKAYATGGAVLPEGPVTSEITNEVDAPKSEVDDASAAFQAQIDSLRRAEQIQRSAPPAPQLTTNQAAFLRDNPHMMEAPHVLSAAIVKAHQAGYEPDSKAFHQAVARHFEHMNAPMDIPMDTPTAKPLSIPDRAVSYYSAPVSRETQANGGYDSYGERPGRVTLSIAQKEAARISGISETEYAEQELRRRQLKSEGYFDR